MSPSPGSAAPRRFDPAALVREYGIVVIFALMVVALAASSPVFLKPANLLNILEQNSAVGIVAVTTAIVFICGGFDLSIGGLFALSGILSAWAVPYVGAPAALVGGVLAGVVAGVLNGLITEYGRINPFVTTLSTAIIFGGLAVVIGGGTIQVTDPHYRELGNGDILGVPVPILVFAVVSIVLGIVLHRTVFGRYIYAVGSSVEAARLAGVRIHLIRISAYAIGGGGAALGGVLIASRAGIGQGTAGGFNLAITAVAAVVIGGVAITGGEGAMWRVVLGVLLLAVIGNGFDLLGINPNLQAMIRGGLILLAVGAATWLRASRSRAEAPPGPSTE